MADADMEARLDACLETMAWVAGRLWALEKLEPHAWDRCTLRELAHALTDSPRLGACSRRGRRGPGGKVLGAPEGAPEDPLEETRKAPFSPSCRDVFGQDDGA